MLDWQRARQRVCETVAARTRLRPAERVALFDAWGRVLAQPVAADRDLPPFPRALRDGFAVRSADVRGLPATLRVVGELRAGQSWQQALGPGEAVRIMTGAPVPRGTDAVVMVEHTRGGHGEVVLEHAVAPGQHVTPAGAEARQGQRLLEPGRRLGAAELALLALVGCTEVAVRSQPTVAIVTTGDELVDPAAAPGPSQIRDANGVALATLARSAGAQPTVQQRVPDEPQALQAAFQQGLEADLLVVSGGVSAGKYDLVKPVLQRLGAEVVFDSVRMRPGRPTLFAWCGERPVFGLPGNPVSAMLAFELFVLPALDLLAGAPPRQLPLVSAQLARPLAEQAPLAHFLPARLQSTTERWLVEPVSWQGSGDVVALAQADGFLLVPPDRLVQPAGETVEVLLRRDRL